VATAGGIMLGLGMIASGLVQTPLAMALTFGVGAGLGIGLGYSATTPPAIKWFPPARKGVITGIVVSGVGLAAVYIAPLTQYLLARFSTAATGSMPAISGIPKTFEVLGVSALILVVLLAQFLRNPPDQAASPAGPAKSAAAPRSESDWQQMLGTRPFYQLWLMMVLSASAGLMIITQVPVIAQDQAKWKWGFVPVATLAVFNTFGRLLSGVLSDRIGRTRTMTLAFLLQAVNMVAFIHYDTAAWVVFGSAFTGLCYGTIFTLMPAATADFYGVRNLGVNYGLVFTAFGVAGVAGPLVSASIRDHSGSYGHAYLLCAGMLVLGALLAMITKPPVVRAAPAAPQPAVSSTTA
jgi:OFA family oxalate/formate antiporter-like MFS transporter